MAKPKTLIAFTEPQEKWLREEAARLDVSLTELVRRLVDHYRGAGPQEPPMIADGYRNVQTKGRYMGEEGTGYGWGKLAEYGDFSGATQGHLQGYTEPIRIAIPAGSELLECRDGDTRLFRADRSDWITKTEVGDLNLGPALTASEALGYGFAQLVD